MKGLMKDVIAGALVVIPAVVALGVICWLGVLAIDRWGPLAFAIPALVAMAIPACGMIGGELRYYPPRWLPKGLR